MLNLLEKRIKEHIGYDEGLPCRRVLLAESQNPPIYTVLVQPISNDEDLMPQVFADANKEAAQNTYRQELEKMAEDELTITAS